MSLNITQRAVYEAHEPLLQQTLTTTDLQTLANLEDGWLSQATQGQDQTQAQAITDQWSLWMQEHPEFRLLAYADNFGGFSADEPEVLTLAVGWRPSDGDPQMASLLQQADNALGIVGGSIPAANNPPVNITPTGGTPPTPSSSMGIILLAAVAAFFLLGSKNK